MNFATIFVVLATALTGLAAPAPAAQPAADVEGQDFGGGRYRTYTSHFTVLHPVSPIQHSLCALNALSRSTHLSIIYDSRREETSSYLHSYGQCRSR